MYVYCLEHINLASHRRKLIETKDSKVLKLIVNLNHSFDHRKIEYVSKKKYTFITRQHCLSYSHSFIQLFHSMFEAILVSNKNTYHGMEFKSELLINLDNRVTSILKSDFEKR